MVDFGRGGELFLHGGDPLAFGELAARIETRRVSHVEPAGWILRHLFHICRRLGGENGILADFTRSWWCCWRVNMGPVEGPTFGRFDRRSEALQAERLWIYDNLSA